MAPTATDPRAETLARLASIDVTLKAILLVLSEGRNGQPSTSAVPERLLEGPHGDPIVKAKDPRDWAGISQQGKRFSECPPDYLDLVAERCDYFLTRSEAELAEANTAHDRDAADAAKKSIKYTRLDAQRARGWAARLRSGWTPPVSAPRVHDAEGEPQW